ncbi:LTA synthase family protein [Gorillibacterium sp. sgz5001074]|uniref:LTA synthase family protein n=1 Tax=Gorillibacterium sp. sgz5001074 TaxID=3446695 RepID=UPI003F677A7D
MKSRGYTLASARRFRSRRLPYASQTAVYLLAALGSLIMALGAEGLQRGSLSEAWSWLSSHPLLFAVNALLAFAVMLLLLSLAGSLLLSAAFAVLLLSAMSLISYFKTKLIGEPFYPWDVILNREGMNIAPLVTGSGALLKIGAVAATVLTLLLLSLMRRKRKLGLTPAHRLISGGLALALLVSVGVQSPWTQSWIHRAGVEEIVWNQQENYANNGILTAFALNVKNSIIPKPAGYNEAAVQSIAGILKEERTAQSSDTVRAPVPVKPNVIFVMSEAFWDPSLLPGVRYSEDPAPTLHRLQEASTSGYLVSPVFGGGTANTEFEVLSGLSMSFLPAGSMAYQQYITKPLPSLASYFKEQGYKSVAVHPYEDWFWNRDKVYPLMGFDSFKSKSQFQDPEVRGAFISDAEVSRSILQTARDTEEPLFLYAVTMQNHGPYDDNRYGPPTIQVQGDMTDSAREALATYAEGIRDADRSLELLMEGFEELDEPTVVVFYGDHLPMLGYDYDTYVQTGFLSSPNSGNWTSEELRKIRSVPFAVWSNIGLPQERIPAMSYSFLGPYILHALHLELPGQFAMGRDVAKMTPVLLRNLTVDAQGTSSAEVPLEAEHAVAEYRLLQYDLLFGRSYLAQYMDTPFLSGYVADRFNE